jgi:hypothetical protein
MDRAFGVLQFRARRRRCPDHRRRRVDRPAGRLRHRTRPEGREVRPAAAAPVAAREGVAGRSRHLRDVTTSRIKIRAQLAKISEPGPLKDVVDRAWQAVKHGLVRGLSVGFLPVKGGTKGNTFNEWMWKELSLVTLPANSQATISNIRSLAASGERRTPSPGVSGTQPNPRHGNMTIQEQITQHENSRAAKVAQRDALLEKSAAEGRTLDQTESETFDTLDGEVRSIDGHLVRLEQRQEGLEKRAVPVNGSTPARAIADPRRCGGVRQVPRAPARHRVRPPLHGARGLAGQQVRSGRVREADVGRPGRRDRGRDSGRACRASRPARPSRRAPRSRRPSPRRSSSRTTSRLPRAAPPGRS